MLTFAGSEMTPEHALAHLRDYADTLPDTIRYYDYGGDLDQTPTAGDGVTLTDIGRLVVINTRLDADDVPALLAPIDPGLWAAVPHDASFADLPDNPTGHPVYVAVSALYGAFRKKGLGPTKKTKTLHLKRPALVPILDSVAQTAYKHAAEQAGQDAGSPTPLYWMAIWRDARANAAQMTDLATDLTDDGGDRAALGALTTLRLHDVIVWSHFRRSCGLPEGGAADDPAS